MVSTESTQARSSGGERYPDTVEVGGSNPPVPTMLILGLQLLKAVNPFFVRIFEVDTQSRFRYTVTKKISMR